MKRSLAVTAVASTAVLAMLVAPQASASGGIWLQQTARPESGQCAEGWNQSWAQWPNGNTGGFVCSRNVDDPSANPDVWLRAGEYQVTGTSNQNPGATVGTPSCMSLGNPDSLVPPSAVRIEPALPGLSVSAFSSILTRVESSNPNNEMVTLDFLCPAGSELISQPG